MGTSVKRASATTELCQRGQSFDIPGEQVDGMDVRAVKAAGDMALEHARSGKGPFILEMLTYRYRGHSMSDPAKYRAKEEVQKMRTEHDPIEQVRQRLEEKGWASEDELKEIDKRHPPHRQRSGRVRAGRPGARSGGAVDRHLCLSESGPASPRVGQMSRGSINHIALTVRDLAQSENRFYAPVLGFLGYEKVEDIPGKMTLWFNAGASMAVNLWQAEPELKDHSHARYAPGFHHCAFALESRDGGRRAARSAGARRHPGARCARRISAIRSRLLRRVFPGR